MYGYHGEYYRRKLHLHTHPGFKLYNWLRGIEMTQRKPALRCGVTEVHISMICSGKKKITAFMANKLEYVLGFPAVPAITDLRLEFFHLLGHIANGDLDHTALLIVLESI